MPKETFISRFSLIIKRLEKGPATYEQIVRFLEDESDISDKNYSISKRTLQRDIKDIYAQLSIEIVNEKKGDKLENPRKLTPCYRLKLTPTCQSNVTPCGHCKLTP